MLGEYENMMKQQSRKMYSLLDSDVRQHPLRLASFIILSFLLQIKRGLWKQFLIIKHRWIKEPEGRLIMWPEKTEQRSEEDAALLPALNKVCVKIVSAISNQQSAGEQSQLELIWW